MQLTQFHSYLLLQPYLPSQACLLEQSWALLEQSSLSQLQLEQLQLLQQLQLQLHHTQQLHKSYNLIAQRPGEIPAFGIYVAHNGETINYAV
jgi:hypothetical protein